MAATRGSSIAGLIAGLAATGFAIALGALVTSQLMLMSVLDTARAELAAEQIADSRFVTDVVAQTVERAITPIAGEALASQLATTASNDPRVAATVEATLLDAHRQIVDPEVGAGSTRDASQIDGNTQVNAAILESVIDAATAAGIDLDTMGLGDISPTALNDAASQAGLPSVVPDDVPNLGLQRVAETTRVVAALVMFALGCVAVIAHPRPARGLGRLGIAVATVCAVWLTGLLVSGWIIGLVADTLFGEMLDDVWREAVPSMMLLTIAGVVIGAGLWFGGLALDGYQRQRTAQRLQQYPPPY